MKIHHFALCCGPLFAVSLAIINPPSKAQDAPASSSVPLTGPW
jgi:hypothetical protein